MSTTTDPNGIPPTGADPGAPAGAPAAAPDTGDDRSVRRRRAAWIVGLVLGLPLLVVAAGWIGLRLFQPHPYSGTVMQAPTDAPSMDGLVWSDGSPVDLAAFEGDLVLVYFGYTYCPDVCPTTLSQVAAALDVMDGDRDRVHVMMVSIDPDRDRPEALGEYVRSFDPAFRGATGELADIERVASTYGVFFGRGEEYPDGGYAMDHTASLMGIGTDGHLRIVWPSDLDTDRLAADLDALL